MIAALFVKSGGCYSGLSDVDPWDETRDARKYAGPWPAVAHPPCTRWGKLFAGQPLWIKRTGERKKKGDDNGCFEAAVTAVRTYGGVLEHPADSHAWLAFGLNEPPRHGGWVSGDWFGAGGWTCCIEQGRYGHYARKPTWLYAAGCELPSLDWGKRAASLDPEMVVRLGLVRAKRRGEVASRGGGTDSAPRIETPIPFRDLLLNMARTASASVVRAAL